MRPAAGAIYTASAARPAPAPGGGQAAVPERLAAVRQDDLWGYIDAKGAWAIRPAYAEATGFNAQGTALVRIDERDVLIDRQGQTVKTLPLGARSWGFRPDRRWPRSRCRSRRACSTSPRAAR